MTVKGGKTQHSNRKKVILVVILLLIIIAGGGGIWWWCNYGKELTANIDDPEAPRPGQKLYSKMTGLEISNNKINSASTFCVQIPNGSTDGARPQVGLNSAAVVFEAIAETGITRFAAIFQDFTDTKMIGPIRSLRPYYLEWDTPFDCTIVHDGGSSEALAEVGNGNYRNLDEDFNYMWKTDYIGGEYRFWNNVFTSPELLKSFNDVHNFTTSTPKTFPRLTPDEVTDILAINQEIVCNPDQDQDCTTPKQPQQIHTIYTSFSGLSDYNVIYQYDAVRNAYLRSYETGGAHTSYVCPDNLPNPPEGCTVEQVVPSAIVIMRVSEHTMNDGYHESIQTTGNGKAIIFQNGQMLDGTWKKSSQSSQIQFVDNDGTEIKFTPGQLWIAAVPQFGSVSWE